MLKRGKVGVALEVRQVSRCAGLEAQTTIGVE